MLNGRLASEHCARLAPLGRECAAATTAATGLATGARQGTCLPLDFPYKSSHQLLSRPPSCSRSGRLPFHRRVRGDGEPAGCRPLLSDPTDLLSDLTESKGFAAKSAASVRAERATAFSSLRSTARRGAGVLRNATCMRCADSLAFLEAVLEAVPTSEMRANADRRQCALYCCHLDFEHVRVLRAPSSIVLCSAEGH